MHSTDPSRRSFIRASGAGLFGLSLAELLALREVSASVAPSGGRDVPFGRAKRCIVLFAWGGMSHIDTFDMKPHAGSDVRSIFSPISTSVPDIQICQHLPEIAKRTDKLAIVRSVHHKASDHREAAYWNLTGHEPRRLGAPAILPSREDWPSLGSMVAFARRDTAAKRGVPGTVSIPYEIADRGLLNGQHAGILGSDFAPVYVKPKSGRPFAGVSPPTAPLNLDPVTGLDAPRLNSRQSLLSELESAHQRLPQQDVSPKLLVADQHRQQAFNMMSSAGMRAAMDLSKEPQRTREAYGDHICGQSVLLARRLTDAGVPLATVYCCAGDLNGSAGSHWDTHGDGFNKSKRDMLPPLARASAALLDDLSASGKLDATLVVCLTEFGRTRRVNGSGGRDHYPNCYSVAFAGAGIAGGQVYGRSDKIGSEPASAPCGPEHLHATIFRALGIDPKLTFNDLQGRPRHLCNAEPLRLG